MMRKLHSLVPQGRTLLLVVLLAALYFCMARIALLLVSPQTKDMSTWHPGNVMPVWPSAGIALAAILLLGFRVWPGIGLGALLLHTSFYGLTWSNLLAGTSIGIGNTLEPCLTAALLHHFVRDRNWLARSQNVFKFIGLAMLTPAVSATIGIISLRLSGIGTWESFGDSWWTWWSSNLFGVLIFAPALLVWSQWFSQPHHLPWRKSLEFLLSLVLAIALSWAAFWQSYPLEHMLIPLLVWSAFRFGQAGTMLMAIVISAISIVGTVKGLGPFSLYPLNQSLLLLQAFIGAIALTALILSAVIIEREQAKAELISANEDLGLMARQLQQSYGVLAEVNEELERRVEHRTAALRSEQEKSDRLLLSILPQPIAEQLKQTQSTIVAQNGRQIASQSAAETITESVTETAVETARGADAPTANTPSPLIEPLQDSIPPIAEYFDEATVLFADIVDFTSIASCMTPNDLVQLLNQIFSSFDRLAERHGLEKIKTVGDEYMVVGGVPVPQPNHAEAIAAMALDMQQEIGRFKRGSSGEPFRLRIGINTGSVVAGVIGMKKFSYDLWGDVVNVASRMESQGAPDKIQVTATTCDRLQGKYNLEERGSIAIKGRGQMQTYWLVSRCVG